MRATVTVDHLAIDKVLYDFVNHEAMPGTGVQERPFWTGFSALARALTPRNTELLLRRDELQSKIDAWHRQNPGAAFDHSRYKAYLLEIGYLVPEKQPFAVDTAAVDPEIAEIAGPQLVVPVSNARYALNAANARWGSLYDALYGTDAISDDEGAAKTAGFNKVRAARVGARGRAFLDANFPLSTGSHKDAQAYRVKGGHLAVTLPSGETSLKDGAKFAGFTGDASHPTAILLKNHNLHAELVINPQNPIGKDDAAGVADIVLESAISTIMDCEDSVAAAEVPGKVEGS